MVFRIIDRLGLLRGKDIVINDKITIHHPKLDEVYSFGEQKYFGVISILTAIPYDFMVQLWDSGVDYEKLSHFDFFCEMTKELSVADTSILLGDLDFKDFSYVEDVATKRRLLYNEKTKTVIDEAIYTLIIERISALNNVRKEERKAGNLETKKFLIETERRRLRRASSQPKEFESQLHNLVSSLVNSKESKYDYETVWRMPIYQFYDAIKRIDHTKHCEQIFTGIYSGNVDSKKISPDSINWLASL